MEDLIAGLELDPLLSPIGLVVVLLGIRLVLGAVKTAVKLAVIALIAFGVYLFLYGGQVTG